MHDRETSASELFVTLLSWARAASATRVTMVIAPSDEEVRWSAEQTDDERMEAEAR